MSKYENKRVLMSRGSRKMPAFEWDVILQDGEHKIKLEHGYISGKRVITVDGKV